VQLKKTFTFLCVVLAILVSQAACSRVTPILVPTQAFIDLPVKALDTVPCPFGDQREGVENQREGLTCQLLEVPEDYAAPEGPKIKLYVAVVHSRNASPLEDPVIVLPSYPGFSSLQFMGFGMGGYSEFLAERDLIFYEMRGTGSSDPLPPCPEMTENYYALLQEEVSPQERLSRTVENYLACRDTLLKSGRDLSLYTPAQHMADLGSLIKALGYSKVNLLADYYGTLLALALLRDYPDSVRSVVLDSLLDQQAFTYTSAESLQSAYNRFFELCAQDEKCQAAYPDLEAEFYAAVRRLDSTPAVVEAYPFGGNQTLKVVVNGKVFLDLARSLLSSSDGIARLPKLVYDVNLNRAYNLAGDLPMYISQMVFVNFGANISASCAFAFSQQEQKQSSEDINPVLQ